MKKDRSIQSLRGMACIMVFFSHYFGTFTPDAYLKVNKYSVLFDGHIAVTIFFVLSGYYVYKSCTNMKMDFYSYLNLIVKRHFRIYPCFIFSIVLALIAMRFCPEFDANSVSEWIGSFWTEGFKWTKIIWNSILVMNTNRNIINPPTWTLHYEVMMFLIAPMLAQVVKKWPSIPTLLLGGMFSFGSLEFLVVYLIGMQLYKNDIQIPKKSMGYFSMILGLVIMGCASGAYKAGWVMSFLFNCCVAMGTYAYVIGVKTTSFSIPILSFIGDISYPFYLCHFIVLLFFRFVIKKEGLIVYGVITFFVSVIISYGMQIAEHGLCRIVEKKQLEEKTVAFLYAMVGINEKQYN